MNDEEFFTIADRVFLRYTENDFVEWLFPESCTLNNKSSPMAIMTCTTDGLKRVKPVVTGEEEDARFLYIKDSVFSFAWYAIMPIQRKSTGTFLKTVRMWIFAPEQAAASEIDNKALKPTTLSQYLTKQFFNLGQYPEIKLASKETIQGYFHKDGYWEAVVPGNKKYYSFYINAQPINFQHRFIISSQYTFYWLEEERPYSGQEVSLRLSPGSQITVLRGTCKSYRSILLSELGCYFSQDGFKSYEELKAEPGLVPVPPEGYFTVDESALLEDGILFLINGTLYWWDLHQRTLTSHPNLRLDSVKGIYQRTSCVNYYPLQGMELGTLLAWEDHRLLMGSEVFKGSKSRYFQPLLVLPPDTTILTACFGSQPVTLACLVINTSPNSPSHPSLLIYNLVDKAWKTSTFLTKFKEGEHPVGPFHMHFLSSAMDALLLWNDHTIIYSFRNDNDWGELLLANGSNVNVASGGKKIHQVILDQSWNMLVKMENNMLYYCKVGMPELVSLHAWRKPNTSNVIYMDQKDQFTPIVQTPDGKLHEQMYPLLMETKSSMHMTHHSCPFITFKNSMTALAYYMDKGDTIIIWAQIVYTEGQGVHVMLLNNNKHLLIISQRSHSQMALEVGTINMTITISQKVDYENVERYSDLIEQTSGVMTLELLPNQIGNTCTLLANRVSHFHVGCPPKRHIRVARPWGMTCEINTLRNYTIPRDVLRSHSKDFLGEDLMVEYDWEKFGCLLKLHYSTEFNPHLDLYDGNTFIKSVEANYIIWEIFGRNDYSFNTTMQQMNCLSEAQTWTSKLTEGKSLETAWGPENYRSCFTVVPEKLGDLDQPYEILNRSSGNYLTFSQVDSAIYVFRVKILDPNYSFCDLTAVFAVQTFGISRPKYEYLTVYVALIFAFLSLCILGYSYCRYVKIFRKVLAARKMKDE
ncbi:cation channel sperm-associated auxiliary subunit epsilon-like [Osmerus mordax]|uniref:cation channel sperm-associated auxiliary subunit epsilon-like n=1 Tax=Osmerus mordax TaxID=8014 RepID=UPI00350F105A